MIKTIKKFYSPDYIETEILVGETGENVSVGTLYEYHCYLASGCNYRAILTKTARCPKCGSEWGRGCKIPTKAEEASVVLRSSIEFKSCENCCFWEPLESWENILCFYENDPHGRCNFNPEVELTSHKRLCGRYKSLSFEGHLARHYIEDTHDVHSYCEQGLKMINLPVGG